MLIEGLLWAGTIGWECGTRRVAGSILGCSWGRDSVAAQGTGLGGRGLDDGFYVAWGGFLACLVGEVVGADGEMACLPGLVVALGVVVAVEIDFHGVFLG